MGQQNKVKLLNSRHSGGRTPARYREIVLILEVDQPATPPIFEFLNIQGCGLLEAESATLNQTHTEWASTNKQWSEQTM